MPLYTTADEVEKICKLLDTDAIDTIPTFINDAETYVNMMLATKYVIPVTGVLQSGTIIASSNTITGLLTDFTNLRAEQHLRIGDSRELVVIESVTDSANIVIKNNVNIPVTGSSFSLIPDEISKATKYYTAYLLLLKNYSDHAYNQEANTLAEDYKKIADDLLHLVTRDSYHNADLLQQLKTKNHARLIATVENDSKTAVENMINEINECFY